MTRRSISKATRAIALKIDPIAPDERGRGAVICKNREAAIIAECVRLLLDGHAQRDIAHAIGASRSRVSRWCVSGLLRHGDVQYARHINCHGQTLAQFLWARIEIKDRAECWPWQGHLKANGYGGYNFKGKAGQAHRGVYECLVGSVQDGQVVDHRCGNRRCCNPLHLQAVSQSANLTLAFARRVRSDADAT